MVRLLLPILFAVLSLLTVIKAPSNFFWRVQVALTEFPWISIFSSAILLIVCFWFDKYRTAAVSITAISLVLFSMPVVRAYDRSRGMTEGFSFWKMFASASEPAFSEMTYKTVNGKSITLDFYRANSKQAPCVIVIHGGSWSSGDNKQFMDWNEWMTHCGYNVAAINYRLAPEFKSPAQVEDVRDAIDFLKSKTELDIDTSNFVLLGRSAGGQIALCAAYQLNRSEITGVISIYAPADMVWGAKITGNPLVLNTNQVFADYLGGGYDQFAEKYYEASAVQHVSLSSPPTLIVHGDNDCMVSFIHSEHLDSALIANNVEHQFLNLPGATHACDYNLNGPSGQLMQSAMKDFLGKL